jgi:alpha-tubulin suppressor-like RCC1 family protein
MDKKVIDVDCGGSYVVTCTEQGDLYTWGEGRFGNLGLDENIGDQFAP